ncbi:head GIN domain-containing protein [Sphingosinicella sp. LHD-64]|uniref:head GIN domain-containing protein n=1 Tax=Sphingosinicella sp. LHD-64 TaxID=3072139 RepID=UPI00280D0353|nr:head GIN domain-containing protein [Sphingosinicella sp. LHD-64]MDQ8756641.1 head GIN domain-containing protein [Sphingosinicella sp. LHD-64]
MRKIFAIGPALLLAAACSVGAQANQHQASGQRGQRNFDVGAFHGVSLRGSHDVVVTVGGQPSVRAEGDTAALDGLDIRVENGVLRVGTQRNWSWNGPGGHVTVHVTAPSLDSVSIGGSGDLRVDRVQAQEFDASISGSGDLEIGALQAREAEFSISGSGGIRAAGTAEAVEVSIAGSGDAALEGLNARRVEISVMGSGGIAIGASESVSGSIMGSGDVTVRGGARCAVSRMGSGDVRCG